MTLQQLKEYVGDTFPCIPVEAIKEFCVVITHDLENFVAENPGLDGDTILWCITKMVLHGQPFEEVMDILGIPNSNACPCKTDKQGGT